MAGLLLYGGTEPNAALRHEVPITIIDAFMLVQDAGRTWIMCSELEAARIAACRPDATLLGTNELGFGELLSARLGRDELDLELTSRAAARVGIKEAIVDFDFPLAVADRLRSDGISIRVDEDAVADLRRVKSESELAGIRRAQAAAEAAMGTAAMLLKRAGVGCESTRRPDWGSPGPHRWSPVTWLPSSPGSGTAPWAAFGSRTCCSSPMAAASC